MPDLAVELVAVECHKVLNRDLSQLPYDDVNCESDNYGLSASWFRSTRGGWGRKRKENIFEKTASVRAYILIVLDTKTAVHC